MDTTEIYRETEKCHESIPNKLAPNPEHSKGPGNTAAPTYLLQTPPHFKVSQTQNAGTAPVD